MQNHHATSAPGAEPNSFDRAADDAVFKEFSEPAFEHKDFKLLLTTLEAGCHNVYLFGGPGSGKTHAANQVARARGVPKSKVFMRGRIVTETELFGFVDAVSGYRETPFRKWFEHGGLLIVNEYDASNADTLLSINDLLENGNHTFPDGETVTRNSDSLLIATANTNGLGGWRDYHTREKLDPTSLDRFAFLNWERDDAVEENLATHRDWLKRVELAREALEKVGSKHLISARAIIMGTMLLARGIDLKTVEKMTLWKGLELDKALFGKIEKNMEDLSRDKVQETCDHFAATRPFGW